MAFLGIDIQTNNFKLAKLETIEKVKIAEENPDLSFSAINDILLGRQQLKEGFGTPYIFGEGD